MIFLAGIFTEIRIIWVPWSPSHYLENIPYSGNNIQGHPRQESDPRVKTGGWLEEPRSYGVVHEDSEI